VISPQGRLAGRMRLGWVRGHGPSSPGAGRGRSGGQGVRAAVRDEARARPTWKKASSGPTKTGGRRNFSRQSGFIFVLVVGEGRVGAAGSRGGEGELDDESKKPNYLLIRGPPSLRRGNNVIDRGKVRASVCVCTCSQCAGQIFAEAN
jgi:hypothetical protein